MGLQGTAPSKDPRGEAPQVKPQCVAQQLSKIKTILFEIKHNIIQEIFLSVLQFLLRNESFLIQFLTLH